MGRSRMSDAAFWALCFLAIGVVVSLCIGGAALSRDMNAMNRAYRTSLGRALIRAGWRVGLFERYRRWPRGSGFKRVGYPLDLYSTDFHEAFPSYGEAPGDPVDGAPAVEGAARREAEAEGRAEHEPPSAGSRLALPVRIFGPLRKGGAHSEVATGGSLKLTSAVAHARRIFS